MNSDIKIITVTKDESDFEYYCKEIEKFVDIFPNNMRRIDNYKKDLRIRDSIAVSVYEKNFELLGFSSVLHRDIFGNGVRILNRFLKRFDFRFQNKEFRWTDESKQMITQQINVAKKYNFDFVFTSRESTNKTSAALSKFFKDQLGWNCPDGKFYVCNSDNDKCQQYITWLPIKVDAVFTLKKVI